MRVFCRLHTLTEEKMKKRISILTDVHHPEIGFWGINATLKDFGKFGIFILNEFEQANLLDENWLHSILNPKEDYLTPPNIDEQWGYSHSWWLADGDEKDFSAISRKKYKDFP